MDPAPALDNQALLKRFAEDLLIRGRSPRTVKTYSTRVRHFARFVDPLPLSEVTPEQIRSFQVHIGQERKLSWSTFNQSVCALRFLYSVTLPRPWPISMIPFSKRPRRLPAVLAPEEVERLIQWTRPLRHRPLFSVLYSAGLRLSEATALSIGDIDSRRMVLHVRAGKGNRERIVPLSPRLLETLRQYWRDYRPEHYLFPGQSAGTRIGDSAVQTAIRDAAHRAGIRKRVTPHTLRHSYATGLLEAGVDLLTIGQLMGHKSFSSTLIYLHVRRPHLHSAPSPLDWLPVRQLPRWIDSEGEQTGPPHRG